ncbi:c-type cytochrome [Halarcobacter ebronensis]|uniref:c-type cytochrome n=1 Tax=Halarcobacter ebronensis TaxID=1462615 RepID=UPI003C74AB4F
MKLLSSIALTSILTATIATAQTTMCFKENHKSMTTIETTALNGGECQNQKSVQDMKKEGWSIADININKTKNGANYIYIFKKEETNLSSINEKALEEKILNRLEERKKQEIATKKKEAYIRKSKSGEKLYNNKCISCHGKNGELKARGVSRPINDLNLQDFMLSIQGYNNGNYDRGMAFVMKPYATLMTSQDIKNVYVYLRSLREKKEKTAEENK